MVFMVCRVFGMVALRLHLYLQIMWVCRLHRAVMSSVHRGSLQPSVKGPDESRHRQVNEHGSLPINSGLPLQVKSMSLSQERDFNYLVVLFTSEGKIECKIDR